MKFDIGQTAIFFILGGLAATAFWAVATTWIHPKWENQDDLIVHWNGNLYRLVPAEKVYRWEEKP